MARGCRERVRDVGWQDAGRSRVHGAGSVWSAPHLLAGPARVGYQDSKFKLNRARAVCLRFACDRLLWPTPKTAALAAFRRPRGSGRRHLGSLAPESLDVRTPRNPIRAAVGSTHGHARAAGGPGAGAGADRARPRRAHEGRAVEGRTRRRLHRQGQDDDRDPGPHRASTPRGCCCSERAGPPRSWTGCCSAATRLPRSAPARARRRASSPTPPIPGEASAEVFAADLALGALLRSYTFKKYRTTRKSEDGAEEEPRDGLRKLVIQCAKPDAAAKAFAARKALAEGVFLARDLVNEPANMLGPVEFAERMRDLSPRRRRGRGARRGPARGPEDGRAAGRRAGQRAALARRRHAVARRQVQARQDAVLRRQGRRASIPAASP